MLYGAADTALSIYVPSVCPIIRKPMKSLLSTHTALQLSVLTDDCFYSDLLWPQSTFSFLQEDGRHRYFGIRH